MHDIKWIRENPETFDAGMKKRGHSQRAGELLAMDAAKRFHLARLQEMQARRNQLAKEVGQAKANGRDVSSMVEEAARI